MKTISAVARYWRRVFVRAFRDTYKLLGHNPVKSVASAAVLFLASGGLAAVGEGSQVFGKIEWWGLSVLAAMSIFVVVFFVVFLFTPWRLQEESAVLAKEQVDLLASRLEGIEAKTSALEQAGQAQMAVHATEREKWAKELDRVRNSDPEQAAIRLKVEKSLAEFLSLDERISQGDKMAARDVYRVEYQVFHYLQKHLPTYTDFTVKIGTQGTIPNESVVSLEDARHRCQERIARLKEVLALF